ncbi:MAG: acyl-CoA dehydrogenase family protein [Sphingopyxis sp.]
MGMTDEQNLLHDALLARLGGIGADGAALAGAAGQPAAQSPIWRALADMGVHGLRVGAELGGAGADMGMAGVVMDALGALCLPAPYGECTIIAGLLHGQSGDAACALQRALVQGAVPALIGLEPALHGGVTCAGWMVHGTAQLVMDGADAAHYVIVAGNALVAVERTDAVRVAQAYPTLDGRRGADLVFDGAAATLIAPDIGNALARARDEAAALIAVEAAGLMRALVQQTTDYARAREQFGQPIGRFQAVQHRLVDMHIAAKQAGAIARAAMAALDGPATQRTRMASAAKATVNDGGRFVGENAVQLHGGMGMTDELAVGRYFKRLTVIAGQWGSTDQHRRQFAAAG